MFYTDPQAEAVYALAYPDSSYSPANRYVRSCRHDSSRDLHDEGKSPRLYSEGNLDGGRDQASAGGTPVSMV